MIKKLLLNKLSKPSEEVNRSRPAGLVPDEDFLFSSEFEKFLPSVELRCIKFGAVLPNGKLLNSFLLEPSQFNTHLSFKGYLKAYAKSLLSTPFIKKSASLDCALFVTNANSRNLFHWFLDVGQKLAFLDAQKNDIKKSLVVVIPQNHKADYVVHCLRAFDLIIYRQAKSELLVSKSFFILPDLAPTGNFRRIEVVSLRRKFRRFWSETFCFTNSPSRIYVTRRNAEKRRIVNEQEIVPILEKNDFLILDFDELSFEDQLYYTLNCDVFVSLHGAALTHMVWINDSAKVLEIRARDDAHNNCYFSLSSDLGHEYHYALADKVDATQTTQQSDFVIDPGYFEARLSTMLK